MPKYILTVNLREEDPSEVLDWLQEVSGDEDACVEEWPRITKPGTDRDAVEQTLAVLARDGWILGHVNDGEDEIDTDTADEALDAIFAVDEAYLSVRKDGVGSGWIRFVLGNEPFEVICDHTVNLSDTLDPMTEKWEG